MGIKTWEIEAGNSPTKELLLKKRRLCLPWQSLIVLEKVPWLVSVLKTKKKGSKSCPQEKLGQKIAGPLPVICPQASESLNIFPKIQNLLTLSNSKCFTSAKCILSSFWWGKLIFSVKNKDAKIFSCSLPSLAWRANIFTLSKACKRCLISFLNKFEEKFCLYRRKYLSFSVLDKTCFSEHDG